MSELTPQAIGTDRETFVKIRPATQLEVIAHGKANLPVIGLPEEPQP